MNIAIKLFTSYIPDVLTKLISYLYLYFFMCTLYIIFSPTCLALTDVFSPGMGQQRASIRRFIKSHHAFMWSGLTPYSYHPYQIIPYENQYLYAGLVWSGLTLYSYYLYQITPYTNPYLYAGLVWHVFNIPYKIILRTKPYLFVGYQVVHQITPRIHVIWFDTIFIPSLSKPHTIKWQII